MSHYTGDCRWLLSAYGEAAVIGFFGFCCLFYGEKEDEIFVCPPGTAAHITRPERPGSMTRGEVAGLAVRCNSELPMQTYSWEDEVSETLASGSDAHSTLSGTGVSPAALRGGAGTLPYMPRMPFSAGCRARGLGAGGVSRRAQKSA